MLHICYFEQLHQRNEAFAHKKLAAQVLSDRVKELENQLSQFQRDEEGEIFSSQYKDTTKCCMGYFVEMLRFIAKAPCSDFMGKVKVLYQMFSCTIQYIKCLLWNHHCSSGINVRGFYGYSYPLKCTTNYWVINFLILPI